MYKLIALTVLIVISAAITIRARYRGPRTLFYAAKPLTTILIILIALLGLMESRTAYHILVPVGLVFCLAGDIFLMFPDTMFIHGLSSFLVGHLFFLGAFISGREVTVTWWLLAAVVVLFSVTASSILPYVKKIKLPVAIYMAVICAMAWAAWERELSLPGAGALVAAVGTLCFALSDYVLAFNKFRKKFKAAQLIILGTYYAAIWMIALSVSGIF